MTTRIGKLLIAVMLAGCGVSVAQAHHSSAMFDESKCQTLAGTVRNFQLQYPHSWIWLLVPNSQGVAEVWGFEGADPATLRRDGWAQGFLKPGDKVEIVFSPLKDGRNGGSLHRVTLPDGHVYKTGFRPCPGEETKSATADAGRSEP